MKRTYKKKSNLINKTGYTPGYDTEKNPVNYIPSESITMGNTPYPLYATPLNQNGEPIGDTVMMRPGGEYKFPGASYVAETPMFAKGGEKNEWISSKISTLVKEGYPQKQAVAIAYSMYNDVQKENGGEVLPMYQVGGGNPFSYNNPFGQSSFDFSGAAPKSSKGKEVLAFPSTTYNAPDLGTLPNPDKKSTNEYLMPGQLPSFNTIFNNTVGDTSPKLSPKTKTPLTNKPTTNTQNNNTTTEQKSTEKVGIDNVQTPDYNQMYMDMSTEDEQLKNPDYNQMYMDMSLEDEQLKPTKNTSEVSSLDLKGQEPFQFFNPYSGVDIPTAGVMFGQSLENKDTLGAIASGAKVALGTARNILGGMGQARRNNYVYNQYKEKQREGMTGAGREQMLEFGGYYQEGGMEQQGTGQEDQIMQQVAQALQQGMSPEEVMQQLIQMGMPEDQAMSLIQGIMQQMQPSTPQLRKGGRMYYQDGGEQQIAQQVAQAMQQGMQPQEAMTMLVESGMSQDQAIQLVQAIIEQIQQQTETPQLRRGGEMIKRADGSYSRRGLWDNIRDNKGSGKTPTKEMLEQEAKIKREYQEGGMEPGGDPTEMIMQQISQMLSQGADPQQIVQMLVEAGVPEDQAMQMIEAVMQQSEQMPEMRDGGIPERYKKMGFSKVGAKKQSTRPGKKWMVLAKKGDQYKIVHGGDSSMKDFSQHGSEDRKENFWNRMGGRDSAKANDPFSPLYWHKKFGTWQEGGEMMDEEMEGENEVMENESAMLEQIESQVEQALKQGADPQQVLQQLVQMGIPQEVAQQMIEEILQEIEGGETEMEAPEQGTPQMSKGGKYMRALVGKTIKNYTYNPKTDSYIVSYE